MSPNSERFIQSSCLFSCLCYSLQAESSFWNIQDLEQVRDGKLEMLSVVTQSPVTHAKVETDPSPAQW